jgi:predicted N-acetyltransferase YhbS
MKDIIRLEEETDYLEVEHVIRDAFWNFYRPGCNEHLVAHNLRKSPGFIKELDFVIERNGEIIASIMYSKVELQMDNGNKIDLIGFGPLAVRPDCQSEGLGRTLILHSMKEAEKLGFESVFITGSSRYYHRFGFESASKYGIYLDENRDGEFTSFMVKLLVEGALEGMSGILKFDQSFDPSKEETEEFDKKFPEKVKEKLPGQMWD